MLAFLTTLFIAGTVLASPVPNDVGVITCKPLSLNASTQLTGPVNYQSIPGSNASFVADWITGPQENGYFVFSDESVGGAVLSFEVCNSTFMGYPEGQAGYYYGESSCLEERSVQNITSCIQTNYPYANTIPQIDQPCSYSDDSSQLLMYWAVSAAPPYSLHFLGQVYAAGEPLGKDLGPAAPYKGFVPGSDLMAVELVERESGYFLGFVTQ